MNRHFTQIQEIDLENLDIPCYNAGTYMQLFGCSAEIYDKICFS